MLVCRNWIRHVLTASTVAALVAAVPAAAIASDAIAHPEGTLKLASRQLVSGSTVLIRGEMFAERGKLQLLLVSVAGRFQLGDVTADSVGGFAESLAIPANLALGGYRLVAIATDEDEVASLNVELLAAAPEADEENEHAGAGAANHSEDGEHAEAAEPTDKPLSLDRAGSLLVTGGAVVAILFAFVTGGLLLRRPQGVAALCAFLAGVAVSKVQAQAPDRDAVIAVVEAVAALAQAHDLQAMDTLFAPDRGIHIIEGAGVNHGWADYRDNHLGPELERSENFQYRFYGVEPTVRGDVAWSSFRYDLAVDTERGHMEREGRGTAVLEKRDGRWLIVHLHTSGRAKRED